MDAFKIEGGTVLNGTIVPQGAKNEALQIVCAVLLTDIPCQLLSDVPRKGMKNTRVCQQYADDYG